jgi:hypothetical protein
VQPPATNADAVKDTAPGDGAPPVQPSRPAPAAAAECRRELVVLGLCGKLP